MAKYIQPHILTTSEGKVNVYPISEYIIEFETKEAVIKTIEIKINMDIDMLNSIIIKNDLKYSDEIIPYFIDSDWYFEYETHLFEKVE